MIYLIFLLLMISSLLTVNASGQPRILGAAQEPMPSFGQIEKFSLIGIRA